MITRFAIAPANAHDLALVADLTEGTGGTAVGDRNYWSPALTADLAGRGLRLVAPYRSAKRDPQPQRSAQLSRLRYRIDTVFGQLVERYRIARVWARDPWHLASRLLRKVLSHTFALLLNHHADNPPLQLAGLLSD